MSDHRVDLDLAIHVPVDNLRHIGAAARAAKGRALPHAPRHQLERTGGDFLTGLGHADDDAFAPAAMAGFQRLAHHSRVAGAVESIVRAAIGQGHQMGDDIALDLFRIDEVGHTEAFTPFPLVVVDIDTDDLVGADHFQALDDIEADTAETEDHGIGAGLDTGRIDHGADAGGHAAADVAGLVERRIVADLGQGNFRQDRVVGEGRAAHIMIDRLALVGKARSAIRH